MTIKLIWVVSQYQLRADNVIYHLATFYIFVRLLFYFLSVLQIEKEEVVLRRVIGSKKDQYFLDKKMVT